MLFEASSVELVRRSAVQKIRHEPGHAAGGQLTMAFAF